jgi:hypothetical protein
MSSQGVFEIRVIFIQDPRATVLVVWGSLPDQIRPPIRKVKFSYMDSGGGYIGRGVDRNVEMIGTIRPSGEDGLKFRNTI